MNEDQSILNSGLENNNYLNDLAIAVCINGESLVKYKKIVEKKYGTDVYSNMVQFANTLQQQIKRRQFTNSSLLSLKFLGKNAGLSEMAIDMIVDHLRGEFREEQQKEEKRKHEDTAFWKQCSPNNKHQLQEYLKKYPTGLFAARAISLIADLERIEKDAVEESRMYNQCRTRVDYMDYLSKYPNGLHKSQAQAKIKEFDRVAAQEREAYVKEKNIFEQCKTKDDYLQYISLYPNGLYVNKAQNKISHLEKIEKTKKEKETEQNLEKEKQIYNQCKTKDDYLSYITQFPNGTFVAQAVNTINKLEAASERDEGDKKTTSDEKYNWICWICGGICAISGFMEGGIFYAIGAAVIGLLFSAIIIFAIKRVIKKIKG